MHLQSIPHCTHKVYIYVKAEVHPWIRLQAVLEADMKRRTIRLYNSLSKLQSYSPQRELAQTMLLNALIREVGEASGSQARVRNID
jgi:hypothetical protein